MKKLIYLASPYSHKTTDVIEKRFKQVAETTAKLMIEGYYIFSPILNSHYLSITHGLAGDWNYWKTFDELIISKCAELWVLKIDGWQESVGVSAEIKIAEEFNLPVKYIEYDGNIT